VRDGGSVSDGRLGKEERGGDGGGGVNGGMLTEVNVVDLGCV
jgi:hypothetical protein